MHERYENSNISKIWSNENKLALWQQTELAVLHAKANLERISFDTCNTISKILQNQPINIAWWKKKDEEIHHDLNAFVFERIRFLPTELQNEFHKDMTSYDTEESPFIRMLIDSMVIVWDHIDNYRFTLKRMADQYRYIIMCSHTHGQSAELQTYGKVILTWYQELKATLVLLETAEQYLVVSKLSGATGNYGSLDPEIEKEALRLLDFDPYYGATQIMPRSFYLPLASTLCQLVQILNKTAIDFRLGARSVLPLWHEPFKKSRPVLQPCRTKKILLEPSKSPGWLILPRATIKQ